jgi:transketolase
VSITGYQLDRLSVEAEQKADSGHPELLLGAEPIACVLWTRFLQHNPANPDLPGSASR